MKRYQNLDADLYLDPEGAYILHSDHEAALNSERDKNAHLKQLLFRAYDYVGVPDDNHSIWGPIRAVLVARKGGDK